MSTKNNSTMIYDGRGHRVASVNQGVLKRTIHNQHILKSPPAIAFDLECLRQAAKAGVVRLEVKNADTGITYKASWQHFITASLDIDFPGYGKQKALPLDGWIHQGAGPIQLDLFSRAGGVA